MYLQPNNEPMKPIPLSTQIHLYALVKLLVKYNKYICMENRYSTLPEIFVQIHNKSNFRNAKAVCNQSGLYRHFIF